MTPQNQIKALAELDGCSWKDEQKVPHKPYLTSYDAIIPLVKKQDEQVIDQMETALGWQWDKTPAQLSEALLRATRKWTDDGER